MTEINIDGEIYYELEEASKKTWSYKTIFKAIYLCFEKRRVRKVRIKNREYYTAF